MGASIIKNRSMVTQAIGTRWEGDSPGARIRKTRIAGNMTIRDLARAAGITPEALGEIEAGRDNASLPTLRRLAEILDVPVFYLGGFERLPEETLRQRITKARLFYGLTKREFAKVIGAGVKTVFSWESGKYLPNRKHIAALEPYLRILDNK